MNPKMGSFINSGPKGTVMLMDMSHVNQGVN